MWKRSVADVTKPEDDGRNKRLMTPEVVFQSAGSQRLELMSRGVRKHGFGPLKRGAASEQSDSPGGAFTRLRFPNVPVQQRSVMSRSGMFDLLTLSPRLRPLSLNGKTIPAGRRW